MPETVARNLDKWTKKVSKVKLLRLAGSTRLPMTSINTHPAPTRRPRFSGARRTRVLGAEAFIINRSNFFLLATRSIVVVVGTEVLAIYLAMDSTTHVRVLCRFAPESIILQHLEKKPFLQI